MTNEYFSLGTGSNTGDDERGRGKVLQPLSLPKNRSTGNLALLTEPTVDRSRYRLSFEGSSVAGLDFESMTRWVHASFWATL